MVVDRRPALDQGHRRVPTAPTSRPGSTRAPGGSSSLCALDNLVKGASGQAIQCANVALGSARDDRAPAGGAVPVSVTAPEGSWPPAGSAGIKAGGVPDVAVVATADGHPVPAAGVFTSNLAAAGPGPGQPGPPRRPPAGGPPA